VLELFWAFVGFNKNFIGSVFFGSPCKIFQYVIVEKILKIRRRRMAMAAMTSSPHLMIDAEEVIKFLKNYSQICFAN